MRRRDLILNNYLKIQLQQLDLDQVLKELKVITENKLLLGEDEEVINCLRCGFEMKYMQACHMICPNCGAHLDCSEKGLTW
jgi:Zn finger protein HypA/HybF involved in hydrogenase expression